MQIKKQQLELDMEKRTGSKLGKEYVKAYLKAPCFLKSRDVTLPTKVCIVKTMVFPVTEQQQLFLEEMPCRYQLGPTSSMYHLKLVFPC